MFRNVLITWWTSIGLISAAAEPGEIPLWPGGAPGSEGKAAKEVVERGTNGERKVSSIHHPSITPYLPRGGHGFGLRESDKKPVRSWITRFEEWLAESGFLAKP